MSAVRHDLLNLTLDDLCALSNRGTVKRAVKELDQGELTWQMSEHEGELSFVWSDGTRCEFPAGGTLHEARCSRTLTGISRHVVRSVLAYQRAHTIGVPAVSASAEARPTEPAARGRQSEAWDPGAIPDASLVACFGKPAVGKARRRFEQGVVVELTRGAKPTARFLDEPITARFMVPGDIRYVSSDAKQTELATWACVAVWAFRELPHDKLADLLSLTRHAAPVPASAAELQRQIDELLLDGFAHLPATWEARLRRVERSLRGDGMIWPADVVVELLQADHRYRERDARFDPGEAVLALGELLCRLRASAPPTRGGDRAELPRLPQLLVCGSAKDVPVQISGGRLLGVGLGAHVARGAITLNAYLQDVDTGSVMTLARRFEDPEPAAKAELPSFARLAQTSISRGCGLGTLSLSQLLIQSGKRSPSGLLTLPRQAGATSLHPQAFQWEQLKPPLLVESLSQLRARLQALPPSYLLPRRPAENLHVVAVDGVDEPHFDAARQRLTARLRDASGDWVRLVHPYYARGHDGFAALTRVLEHHAERVRFACGHVRLAAGELELRPVSLVVDDGKRRVGVQTFIGGDSLDGATLPNVSPSPAAENSATSDELEHFPRTLHETLGELLLVGVRQLPDAACLRLVDAAAGFGFVRLLEPMRALASELTVRAQTLRWDPTTALRLTRDLFVLARVATEQAR